MRQTKPGDCAEGFRKGGTERGEGRDWPHGVGEGRGGSITPVEKGSHRVVVLVLSVSEPKDGVCHAVEVALFALVLQPVEARACVVRRVALAISRHEEDAVGACSIEWLKPLHVYGLHVEVPLDALLGQRLCHVFSSPRLAAKVDIDLWAGNLGALVLLSLLLLGAPLTQAVGSRHGGHADANPNRREHQLPNVESAPAIAHAATPEQKNHSQASSLFAGSVTQVTRLTFPADRTQSAWAAVFPGSDRFHRTLTSRSERGDRRRL